MCAYSKKLDHYRLTAAPHLVSFLDLIWSPSQTSFGTHVTSSTQYICLQDCTYAHVWIGVDDRCCSQWALLLWQWLPSFGSMWRFYQVSSRNTICYCARCWSDLYSSEAQKPSCICRSLVILYLLHSSSILLYTLQLHISFHHFIVPSVPVLKGRPRPSGELFLEESTWRSWRKDICWLHSEAWLVVAVEEFPLVGFAADVCACVSTKPDTVNNFEALETYR